ncbi:MAG: hypothetical protein ABIG36_10300 [Pseudomonadota bacterium]
MEWWGYSKEHGWVVLDRSIPSNKPGSSEDLLFFRCRDLKTFLVPKNEWDPPLYVYAPTYLEGLGVHETDDAKNELESLKARWPEFQAEIQRQIQSAALAEKRRHTTNLHKYFLLTRGIPYQGTAAAREEKLPRVTHCYKCQQPLDNMIDLECMACKWIICSCGACGCGYVSGVV